MSFLAPWFLMLGTAIAVPLLLHLLRRRMGVEVEFPAARYLLRAEREHSRSLRMRNLLLMLLRIAAVILLALAAARPATRLAGTGHAPTALAIVLDNSLSTAVVQEGTPLLDLLKRTARDVVAASSPDDRLWLLTVDGAVRGGSAMSLADEVDRVRPHAGAGRLRDVVARAIATTGASDLAARQVVVLTDGQRTAWREPAGNPGNVPVLVFAPAGEAPPNRAVALADARPVRWTPRGGVAMRALAADSTTYRMELGERTLARGTVAPGEEAVIRAAPVERGWTAGMVEIQPDELPADNARHFAVWIGTAPAVRLASGASDFLRNAVEVLRVSGRVVEEGGAAITAGPADRVAGLPALILPPPDGVRIGAANRALERLGIPWRYGAVHRENAVARGEQLRDVNVAWRHELVPRGVPDAETLAVVGRDAWVVSGPRYVLVGSPLVPEATSLPVSAAFLPWLGDVLSSRLHTEPGSVRFATPGASVVRPTGVDAIESRAGERIPAAGTHIEAPATPGTYFLIQGARRVGALVVNPDLSESMLARWGADDRELGTRVAVGPTRVVRDPDEVTRRAFTGSSRRSIVVPLLFLALVILSIEMVAAAADAGQRRT